MGNTLVEERFILAQARAGSSAAFEELIGPCHQSLYRRALKLTQNEEDAEDIVQDAELKAYCKLDQFNGHSRFYTWMTRIVINESLMKLRKRRCSREMQLLDPALLEERNLATPQVGHLENRPNRWFASDELRSILKRALGGLSPSVRSTFLLCYMEGYSAREVASMSNLSVAAIKSRLLRTRRRLSRRLKAMLQAPVRVSQSED